MLSSPRLATGEGSWRRALARLQWICTHRACYSTQEAPAQVACLETRGVIKLEGPGTLQFLQVRLPPAPVSALVWRMHVCLTARSPWPLQGVLSNDVRPLESRGEARAASRPGRPTCRGALPMMQGTQWEDAAVAALLLGAAVAAAATQLLPANACAYACACCCPPCRRPSALCPDGIAQGQAPARRVPHPKGPGGVHGGG